VAIDRFTLGSLGMVSLEAIACGKPVLCYVSSDYPESKNFPLKDLLAEEEIAELITNHPRDLWEKEHAYLKNHHEVDAVVSSFKSSYQELL